MNDIQKKYLLGLVLKKVRSLDREALKEINPENDSYYESIEQFVEACSENIELAYELFEFQNNNVELYYLVDKINIEKIGLFITVKMDEIKFTISHENFHEILISLLSYYKEYLPLGSVVRMSDDKLVVIEQRMVQPKQKNYFIDYRAIPYPMGIFNEAMYIYLSSEEIKEVVFTGYSDLENEGYELALKESLIDNGVFAKTYQDKDEE